MARRSPGLSMAGLALDREAPAPLSRQLYDLLREAILGGRLRPGSRLPSTRRLAAEVGASRNTVLAAFEQLTAEGYLEGRIGSGTTVARTVPETLLTVPPLRETGPGARARGMARGGAEATGAPRRAPGADGLSRRGAGIAAAAAEFARVSGPPRPFRPGLPALDVFPFDLWARLSARRWRRASSALLDYGAPAGHAPLREAVAAHLRVSRAVRCEPEQVIVVTGSQQGIDLAARILLDPGDPVWVEDPGYLGARGALAASGARLIGVAVDAEGLDIDAAARRGPAARLVHVTPSHQYPTGSTLSLSRRLALLDWARRTEAWVVEDDYDSEYRYGGRPLAALQGLDRAGRVIYLGTFSKVLFPALRLGYLVVPPGLVDAFARARWLTDRHSPSVTQAVLADFIAEGHLARHIRRTRALYAERQAALVEAAGRHLAPLVEVTPAEAGMHLVGWLPAGMDDGLAARQAADAQVAAPSLSSYRLRPGGRGGLVLGYAAFRPAEIRESVERLAMALAPRRGERRATAAIV
ncbi:MAG: GntR family transcriptional regulator [Candidatus Rokubacteria bacterium RIFCSPLOWO2_12_FULL_71_19]|nr:MAG: GntR family transcriptional regulator [Candidatus Rokubacteria bacterium RIFCSPLOWO2_12_FULL_71_19]